MGKCGVAFLVHEEALLLQSSLSTEEAVLVNVFKVM